MARQPRLIVPHVALHIVQRGVNRQDCFRQDNDRLVYLSLLREFLASSRCILHAYCLMTNHVHLMLTPITEDGPSALMYRLGQHYVPYFNRRYGRTGTLWEGRFKSCLVDSARYVLTCYRYVEMNPVEARMVADPVAYSWSSFRGNAGLGEDALLTPHVEYAALGSDPANAYRSLFKDPLDPALVKEIREATLGGYALVGDVLKAQLKPRVERPLERRKPGPRPADAITQDSASGDLDL
jgi:putative transposase